MDDVEVKSWGESQIGYEITGPTREAVEARCDDICRHFHPCGYGTHFKPAEEIAPGKWKATGSRWSSCD